MVSCCIPETEHCWKRYNPTYLLFPASCRDSNINTVLKLSNNCLKKIFINREFQLWRIHWMQLLEEFLVWLSMVYRREEFLWRLPSPLLMYEMRVLVEELIRKAKVKCVVVIAYRNEFCMHKVRYLEQQETYWHINRTLLRKTAYHLLIHFIKLVK